MSKTLKVLQAIVRGGRELKCEACGNDFVCAVSLKGCWCSEIALDEKVRAELRSSYKDCLCRNCLETRKSPDSSSQ